MSTDTKTYTWKTMPRGGIIPEAGNAAAYKTGSWRTYRPVWDPAKCSHCLTCWILCPDSSIQAEKGKMKGIDYEHCKGCGICARECPDKRKPLSMVLETEAEKKE